MMSAFTIDPRTSLDKVERRLGHIYVNLTERERSVCARTMIGMTAEAIAIDLDISPSTVLTYRRRAYERYQITNCSQFFLAMI